jgi:pimeloyl-ACP methyl ester carboxylesterase
VIEEGGRELGWNHIFAATYAALLAGCTPDDPLIAPAGQPSSAYTVAGHGSPAIVFVSGAGESRLSWSSVFLALSTDTTVFAYDRPGAVSNPKTPGGFTPDEDGLTSTEEAVRHLRELLAEARTPPPYVLVGHSLGGSYVLKYVQLHPKLLFWVAQGAGPEFRAPRL